MADIDYDKLGDAIARALRRNSGAFGGSSGGNTGSSSSGFDSSKLKEAGQNIVESATSFVDAAKESASTWQGLSKYGANFSNDLIGMNVAAAGSRLSLNDFANIIAQNGKQMAGLGGSVTRGAEAFGKLSKEFFDSNTGDALQQMGYSAKDLNEVLALQASTSRYTMGVEGDAGAKSRRSAADLAKEMDAIAKLTGKSKDEQMEAAKKRATDGQIEAKLRLIGIEQGADAEAAAREGFQKQMAAAEARGMGQMAKEMFATGTVTSEEAATQYALLGEAAQKTGEQMAHLSKGNIVAAEAANKEAEAANAKNQRDPTLLRMAAMGDAAGSVGTILKKSTEDNMALHDSVMGLVKGNTNLLKSQSDYATALSKIRDDITASQQGKLGPGQERVSGATRGVVASQIAAQNLGAGVAAATEVKDLKTGQSIAGAGRRAGETVKEGLEKIAGPEGNAATYIEDAAKKGMNPQPFVPKPGEGKYAAEERKKEESGGIIGNLVKGISITGNTTVDIVRATLNLKNSNIAANYDGGYIKEPILSTLAEKGPEFVLNEGQMRDTISAAGMSGVKNILGKLPPPDLDTKEDKFKAAYESMKGMAPPRGNPTGGMDGFDLSGITKAISMSAKAPAIDMAGIAKAISTAPIKAPAIDMAGISKAISMPAKTEPNINMTEMSKTISTSISSMTGGESTTKRVQSDDSKSAEKEMSELKSKFNEDMAARKNILIEGMSVEDRKFSKVQAVMKADDEAIKLKEEFSKKQEELQKKIADGITWETSKKQESLEETKKLVTEQLSVTVQGQEARLIELEKEEALKLIGVTQGAEAENEARSRYQKEIAEGTKKLITEQLAVTLQGQEARLSEIEKEEALKLIGIEQGAEAEKAAREKYQKDTSLLNMAATGSEEPEAAMGAGKYSAPIAATPAIDLNAVNLPGFGAQMKANAASVPAAVNKTAADSDTARENAKFQRKADENKEQAANKSKEEQPTQRGGKTAALEDVVKGLDMLNITMNKLLSQSDDLGRKQITALEKNPKNMYS